MLSVSKISFNQKANETNLKSNQPSFGAKIISGNDISYFGKDVYSYIPKNWKNITDIPFDYEMKQWLTRSEVVGGALNLKSKHSATDQFILNSKEVKKVKGYVNQLEEKKRSCNYNHLDAIAEEIGFIEYLAKIRKNADTVTHEKIEEIYRFKEKSDESLRRQAAINAEALDSKVLNAFR